MWESKLNPRLKGRKKQFKMSRQKDKIIVVGGKRKPVNAAAQIDHVGRELGTPVKLLGFAIDDETIGKQINGYNVLEVE